MIRPEVIEPVEFSLSDIGVNLSQDDLLRFRDWSIATALFKTTQHNVHGTTHDTRAFSNIRKLPLPFDPQSGLPSEFMDIAQGIYKSTIVPISEYFGTGLTALPTRYAAEVHTRYNGDGPGEGHVDYYPSCNVYFSDNRLGGELVIARNPSAKNLAEIARDAFRVRPQLGKLAIFNGEFLPHYVDEPADDTARVNLVLAYHYDKQDADTTHPRHYLG